MPSHRPHDPALIAQARTIYEAHGSRRAAEQTGIPRRTVNDLARRNRWQPPRPAGNPRHLRVAPVAATQPASAKAAGHGWQPHAVLGRLARELWAELDDLERCRAAGRARDSRDVAVTVAVLVDKCQALAKQLGHDSGGDAQGSLAHITAVLDAIEQRQAGNGSAPS